MRLTDLNKKQILNLAHGDIIRELESDEIIHIFKTLNAFWYYDYEAAEEGRVGLHAELKSGRCSDGFFYSKLVLDYPNIREILANQLVMRFNVIGMEKPVWVAGIPKGAKELGKDAARSMGVRVAEMEKIDGKITLLSSIHPGESLLLFEDFCSKGTGFTEAVRDIVAKQPDIDIYPVELVILNRGGLKEICVDGIGTFKIVSAAEHRIQDWSEKECPLCAMGSERIKPKATDENWRKLIASQQDGEGDE